MASPSFNVTGLYDSATFSDVTIKFSRGEIKCHKVVLYQGSDYFKALCGPESQFAESKQAVIELHDDDPDAVDMMLRHFYNFPYDIYKAQSYAGSATKLHMNVFVTAKKYLVEGLREDAFAAILAATQAAGMSNADPRIKKDFHELFEAINILDAHRDQHEYFGKLSENLTKHHLGDLLTLPDFRRKLEEGEIEDTLDFVIQAV